jgi:hypothetical protein
MNIGICDESSMPEDEFAHLSSEIPENLKKMVDTIFVAHDKQPAHLLDAAIYIFDESEENKDACSWISIEMLFAKVYYKTCKRKGYSLIATICLQVEAILRFADFKICATCNLSKSSLNSYGDCADCVEEKLMFHSVFE